MYFLNQIFAILTIHILDIKVSFKPFYICIDSFFFKLTLNIICKSILILKFFIKKSFKIFLKNKNVFIYIKNI